MTRRIAAIAAALALAGLAAGCASSPVAILYTLSPGATATAKADPASSKLVIVVGPISIPAIVDMPQIVVSTGANQVALDRIQSLGVAIAETILRKSSPPISS